MEPRAVCVPTLARWPVDQAPADTVERLEPSGARSGVHDLAEVAACNRPAPSSLSVSVARPSICHNGSVRLGNAIALRPNSRAPAAPSRASDRGAGCARTRG